MPINSLLYASHGSKLVPLRYDQTLQLSGDSLDGNRGFTTKIQPEGIGRS